MNCRNSTVFTGAVLRVRKKIYMYTVSEAKKNMVGPFIHLIFKCLKSLMSLGRTPDQTGSVLLCVFTSPVSSATDRQHHGNWTTRGYANSRIANSRTGHLADWSTCGLDNSRTGQLAISQMPPKRKTKHAKSPMASASCPVTNIMS